LFEIDEASLPGAVGKLKPRVVVITNLFRDQMDRYFELDTLAKRIGDALASLDPNTKLVLNADDPLVANLAVRREANTVFFGMDDPDVGSSLPQAISDATRCPRCRSPLVYRRLALADAFGALAGVRPASGRLETVDFKGRQLRLVLVKNPAGFNAATSALLETGRHPRLIAALNDRDADGRDVSWIWDADFESLAPAVEHAVITGVRSGDLALRFKYAGLAKEKLELVSAPAAAIERA